ncbi:MAG: ABC transporter ATP-binding protein, partial [Pirellulaceae bacterium]|nr:ABC transporter ATP-binding protein [Pirellulaceae bacterium]
IKVLLGIVRKSGGHASLLGRAAGDRVGRARVGYLPENLRIPRHLNAYTALEYYGRLSGLSMQHVRDRRDMLLEQVRLTGREKDSVKKYSKGMLQRLGLAQALLHEPELLILDEPTDGLDPRGRSEVRHVLNSLKEEGKTVFLNSHILQEVELVCDRVAILDKGILKSVGAIDEIAPRKKEFQGVELEVTVQADRELVEEALGDRGVMDWQPLPHGQSKFTIRLGDQEGVDQLVDDMRGKGVSLVELTPHRISLEDAFLEILSDNDDATTNVDGDGGGDAIVLAE